MRNASRENITTLFLFLIIALNVIGFIVREYLTMTTSSEEQRWIAHMYAGAHITVGLCAFLIWRGKQAALYLLLAITLFVIVTDLGLTFFDPVHHPSIPDIILAFSESVILLILLKPWKSDHTKL
jgi:hypothetical protein